MFDKLYVQPVGSVFIEISHKQSTEEKRDTLLVRIESIRTVDFGYDEKEVYLEVKLSDYENRIFTGEKHNYSEFLGAYNALRHILERRRDTGDD